MQGLVETGSFKEAVKYVNFKVLSGNIKCCSIISLVDICILACNEVKTSGLAAIHIRK